MFQFTHKVTQISQGQVSDYLGIKRNLTAEKGIPGLISLSLS